MVDFGAVCSSFLEGEHTEQKVHDRFAGRSVLSATFLASPNTVGRAAHNARLPGLSPAASHAFGRDCRPVVRSSRLGALYPRDMPFADRQNFYRAPRLRSNGCAVSGVAEGIAALPESSSDNCGRYRASVRTAR